MRNKGNVRSTAVLVILYRSDWYGGAVPLFCGAPCVLSRSRASRLAGTEHKTEVSTFLPTFNVGKAEVRYRSFLVRGTPSKQLLKYPNFYKENNVATTLGRIVPLLNLRICIKGILNLNAHRPNAPLSHNLLGTPIEGVLFDLNCTRCLLLSAENPLVLTHLLPLRFLILDVVEMRDP
jgi:hypothetical protein